MLLALTVGSLTSIISLQTAQAKVETFPMGEVTQVSAGLAHTCAVADSQAYCWGMGGSGQLGSNTTTSSSTPVAVDTIGVLSGRTITQIAAGGYHTCALTDDGQAYCWGRGQYGQLGNSNVTRSSTPMAVSDVTNIITSEITDVLFSAEGDKSILTIVGDGLVDMDFLEYGWEIPATDSGSTFLTLNGADLPPGAHTVYVTITNPDNTVEELGPYSVAVPGDTTLTNLLAPNTGFQSLREIADSPARLGVVIVTMVGLLGVSIFGITAVRKRAVSRQ